MTTRTTPRPFPFRLRALAVAALLATSTVLPLGPARAETPASNAPPAEKTVSAPNGLAVSVKMIGPVTQTTDLQIICVLKHDLAPGGDKYIEAMADFDGKLGGLLSTLRERGEFVGDPGETLLFTPPPNSITPKRVLFVGVGAEAELSLDRLKVAGRVAAREATRLGAAHVSWAPTLRDQGSSRIDVGEGDAAFAEQFVLAYDTERRLQAQGLSQQAEVRQLVIEAGPKYFEGAAAKVAASVDAAAAAVQKRADAPYSKVNVQAGK